MARRSCRNSALVRSYARKAGGDGSLQARFALRPTASHVRARPPPTAPYPVTKLRTSRPRTPVAATAFGELTVRRRVCLPELRLPAAASTVGASWQAPALWRVPFRNCPRSRGMPGPVTARLAADVAANGRCGRAHPTATARPMARPVSQLHAPWHILLLSSCPYSLWSAAVFLDAAHKKATS